MILPPGFYRTSIVIRFTDLQYSDDPLTRITFTINILGIVDFLTFQHFIKGFAYFSWFSEPVPPTLDQFSPACIWHHKMVCLPRWGPYCSSCSHPRNRHGYHLIFYSRPSRPNFLRNSSEDIFFRASSSQYTRTRKNLALDLRLFSSLRTIRNL